MGGEGGFNVQRSVGQRRLTSGLFFMEHKMVWKNSASLGVAAFLFSSDIVAKEPLNLQGSLYGWRKC